MRGVSQNTRRALRRVERILIAGSGGQGIMVLGRVLSCAAMLENKNVTYIRSYGAEMRGGTASCMIKISKHEIASPVFKEATIAIFMNQPSLDKFERRVEKGRLLIINESSIEKGPKRRDVTVRSLKFNDLADTLGSIKVANTIALGFLLKEKSIVEFASVEKAIRDTFGKRCDLVKINLEALKAGYKYG